MRGTCYKTLKALRFSFQMIALFYHGQSNFSSDIQSVKIREEKINTASETKVLGVAIDSKFRFATQKAQANNTRKRKGNLMKPFVYAGLKMHTFRRILTTVIISKACYENHLWETDHSVKVYGMVKDILRHPYKPPEQTLTVMANIVPRDIQFKTKRLAVVKQLVISGDMEALINNTKSKLHNLFVADLVQPKGRGVKLEELTKDDFRKSVLMRYEKAQWLRE